MSKLTVAEIRAALAAVPGWTRRGAVIRRTYVFADFVAAIRGQAEGAGAAARFQLSVALARSPIPS